MRITPLMLLAALACADPHDPLEQPIPTGPDEGRLVATGFDGGDGAFVENGIHDRVLGIDCAPRRDSFGVMRCLPAANVGVRFQDQKCTRPVVVTFGSGDGEGPKYAVGPSEYCGGQAGTTYVVGRETSNDGVFQIADGRCTRIPQALTAGSGAYAGGALGGAGAPTVTYEAKQIEPKYFAVMTAQRDTASPEIDRTFVVAVDGRRFDTRLILRETDTSCWLTNEGERVRCNPASYVSTVEASATCDGAEVAVAPTYGECAAEIPKLAWTLSNLCEPRRLVRVGAPTDPEESLFIDFGDGICREWGGTTKPTAYAVESVDPETLPSLGSIGVGDGRLEARVPVDQNGAPIVLPTTLFYDRELETPCFPRDIDGAFLCLPHATSVSTIFTDDVCAAPIRVAYVAQTVPKYAFDVALGELYELGAPVDASTLYGEIANGCHTLPSERTTCVRYRQLGPRVELSRLARVEPGMR